MKQFLLTILFFLIVKVTSAFSISGVKTLCPGTRTSYTLSGYDLNKSYYWTISGGTFDNGQTEMWNYGPYITWSNDGAAGKITVKEYTSMNLNSTNTATATYNVDKFNLKAPYGSGGKTLSCGSTAQIEATFNIEYAGNYKDYSYDIQPNSNYIIIPTGWTIVSLINYESTTLGGKDYRLYKIKLIPDGVHFGDVKIRFRSNSCAWGEWSNAVSFSPQVPTLIISGPAEVACGVPQQITYTASGGTNGSYSWTYPSNWSKLSETGNSITFNSNGVGGQLKLTSNNGCGNKIEEIKATNNHLYIEGEDGMCSWHDGFIPYGISSDIGLPANFTTIWSGAQFNYVSNYGVSLVQLEGAGILTITVKVITDCDTTVLTKKVVVGTPDAPGTMQVQGETLADLNASYTYTIPHDYPSATGYTWELVGGGGNFPPTINIHDPYVTITFNQIGTYYLKPIVYGPCGKVDLDHENITITVVQDKTSGNYYSAKSESINMLTIQDTNKNIFSFFPNPAKNELIVSLPTSTKVIANQFKVNLIDVAGKVLLTASNGPNENLIKINTSNIASGTYFLHLVSKDEVKKEQIIIQH